MPQIRCLDSPEKPLLSCGTMGSIFAMGPPGRKPDVMLKPAGLGSFPAPNADMMSALKSNGFWHASALVVHLIYSDVLHGSLPALLRILSSTA